MLWGKLVAFSSSVPLFAQGDRGAITGTVSDPVGAVVENAPIEVRNVDNGSSYQGGSSATGNYVVQVPTGNYEMAVAVPGFKRYVRQSIAVPVARTLRIDVSLEVGSNTESVTVTEAAPLLKTESGELSHNVATDTLNSLPVLGIGAGNDKETVSALLDGGADINLGMADGSTALVVAIISTHYELAKYLLEKGADPNLQDGKGMGALYGAIDMRNMMTTDVPSAKGDNLDPLELVKLILNRGGQVNMRLTAKLPYRGGTNPTWQSEVGATPFLRAAYSNDVVMRLLLAYCADPNINASDKTTPLMAAAGVGWLPSLAYTRNENVVESLRMCLELGNDIHQVNDGKPNSRGPSGLQRSTAQHSGGQRCEGRRERHRQQRRRSTWSGPDPARLGRGCLL